MSRSAWNCGTLRSDSGEASTSAASARTRSGSGSRSPQHGGRLVEQAAQERRTDMTGVKDEMQRPRIRDLACGFRDRRTRKPGALSRGAEDAVVEETRRPVSAHIETDDEHEAAHEVDILRVGVRRNRQQRPSSLATGFSVSPFMVHYSGWHAGKNRVAAGEIDSASWSGAHRRRRRAHRTRQAASHRRRRAGLTCARRLRSSRRRAAARRSRGERAGGPLRRLGCAAATRPRSSSR